MDSLLPAAEGIDAAAAAVSLAIYLVAGLAIVARFPRDSRARIFFVVVLTNVLPYLLTIQSWRSGAEATWTRTANAGALLSVAIGSVALFHFTQVFPRRRPWIQKHARLLVALYVVAPLVGLALVVTAPADAATITLTFLAAALILGLPWTLLVLAALPFAGLMSLVASYREAAREGDRPRQRTTMLIVISQLAGGILAVLVILPLRVVAPHSALVTAAALLFAASGILMPAAVALGVFRYRLLAPGD